MVKHQAIYRTHFLGMSLQKGQLSFCPPRTNVARIRSQVFHGHNAQQQADMVLIFNIYERGCYVTNLTMTIHCFVCAVS